MFDNIFASKSTINAHNLIGILYDLLLGTSASKCANRLDLDEGTVQKYYALLRTRIAFNPACTPPSWPDFPPREDETWHAIFKCGFCKKGKSFDEERLGAFHTTGILSADSISKINLVRTVRQLTKCEGCPFSEPVILPADIYREHFREVSKSSEIDAENFFEYYFLYRLRSDFAHEADAPQNGLTWFLQNIIMDLVENPL